MTSGEGSVHVPKGDLLIVDPRSKVLRAAPYVEEYRQWKQQQRAAQGARK
jgi:hypothetical protein